MSRFVLPGVSTRQESKEARQHLDPAYVGAVKRVETEGGRVGRIAVVRLKPEFVERGDGSSATVELGGPDSGGLGGDHGSRNGAEERIGIPDGYSVGSWDQGLVGPGMYIAEADLKTPEGLERIAINVSTGVVYRRPLSPQAAGSLVSHEA